MQWLYQKSPEPNQNDNITFDEIDLTNMDIPPLKDLEWLYDLSLRGNLEKVIFMIEKLAESNAKISMFSSQVKRFAERFQVKQLKDFIVFFIKEQKITS